MAGKQPKRKPRPGVDEYGRTALHDALVPISRKIDLKAIGKLLKRGADPNAQDDNGFTPLHFAAQEASPEATRMLLEAGADHTLRDAYGNTPLFKAVMNGRNIEVVRLLLDAGADPFLENNYESSAAKIAFGSTADDPEVAQFIRQCAKLFESTR